MKIIRMFGSGTALLLVLLASTVHASVMSGGSYQVVEDSLDLGGGRSNSSQFRSLAAVGGVAVGNTTSENFTSVAGYTPNLEPIFLSLETSGPVLMTPDLGGLSGGEANGTLQATITTDGTAGYQLSIKTDIGPAMRSASDHLDDYVPATTTDFDFVTNPEDAHFGYSVFGQDAATAFLSNGSSCGVGSSIRGFCWRGLSADDTQIAERTSATDPDGSALEVLYRIGIGGEVVKEPGIYVATTTITVLPR